VQNYTFFWIYANFIEEQMVYLSYWAHIYVEKNIKIWYKSAFFMEKLAYIKKK